MVVVAVVKTARVVVTIIPVVVRLAIGVVVPKGYRYIYHPKNNLLEMSDDVTLVVTVPVVGGVVDVVVVLDKAGFQISNLQNALLLISADSASIQKNIIHTLVVHRKEFDIHTAKIIPTRCS